MGRERTETEREGRKEGGGERRKCGKERGGEGEEKRERKLREGRRER